MRSAAEGLPLAEIAIVGTWGGADFVTVIGDVGQGIAIASHVSSSLAWAARDIIRSHHLDAVDRHFRGDCWIRWDEQLEPPDGLPRECSLVKLRELLAAEEGGRMSYAGARANDQPEDHARRSIERARGILSSLLTGSAAAHDDDLRDDLQDIRTGLDNALRHLRDVRR